MTGLRVDIRSETDFAEQEAYQREYGGDSWAEGEWRDVDGIQMWFPADGSEPMTQEQVDASSAAGDSEQESAIVEGGDTVGEAVDVEVQSGATAGEQADGADTADADASGGDDSDVADIDHGAQQSDPTEQ